MLENKNDIATPDSSVTPQPTYLNDNSGDFPPTTAPTSPSLDTVATSSAEQPSPAVMEDEETETEYENEGDEGDEGMEDEETETEYEDEGDEEDQEDEEDVEDDHTIDDTKSEESPEAKSYQQGLLLLEKKDKEKAVRCFEKLANQEYPPALFQLGLCRIHGKGIEIDREKGHALIEKAAELGDANALLHLDKAKNRTREAKDRMCETWDENELKGIVEQFQESNKDGCATATCYLSIMHDMGIIVSHEPEIATALCQKAANRGDKLACGMLAIRYKENIALPKDRAAHVWLLHEKLKNRTEKSLQHIQYELGLCYLYDRAPPKILKKKNGESKEARDKRMQEERVKEALGFFEKAARKGHLGAQCELALYELEHTQSTTQRQQAINKLIELAQQNYPYAQYKLAHLYGEGKYVARDIGQKKEWLSKAAINDWAEALYEIGISSAEYPSLPSEEKPNLLYMAAKLGHSKTLHHLINQYESGTLAMAEKEIALLYGMFNKLNPKEKRYPENKDILYELARLHDEGGIFKDSLKEAFDLYKLATFQNHKDAWYALGLFYCGTKRSFFKHSFPDQIQHCFEKAANLGHEGAKAWLKANKVPQQKRIRPPDIRPKKAKAQLPSQVKKLSLSEQPEQSEQSKQAELHYQLACSYEQKNPDEALKNFQDAARLGHKEAQQKAQQLLKKISKHARIDAQPKNDEGEKLPKHKNVRQQTKRKEVDPAESAPSIKRNKTESIFLADKSNISSQNPIVEDQQAVATFASEAALPAPALSPAPVIIQEIPAVPKTAVNSKEATWKMAKAAAPLPLPTSSISASHFGQQKKNATQEVKQSNKRKPAIKETIHPKRQQLDQATRLEADQPNEQKQSLKDAAPLTQPAQVPEHQKNSNQPATAPKPHPASPVSPPATIGFFTGNPVNAGKQAPAAASSSASSPAVPTQSSPSFVLGVRPPPRARFQVHRRNTTDEIGANPFFKKPTF